MWEWEVYSPDDNKVVYSFNGQKLFTPGSTTKLLTEGVGLDLLGADYRFHTRIYRTGPISKSGILKGNLISVGERGRPESFWSHSKQKWNPRL